MTGVKVSPQKIEGPIDAVAWTAHSDLPSRAPELNSVENGWHYLR